MRIDFEYSPLTVHTDFHRSRAYERCMFGAFGSGKTYSLCAEAIAVALEQPGSRLLITRKTIPELRDTTETVFFDILPHELRKAGDVKRLGGHVSDFTFPNGSKVLFRGIDDWMKHKSLNVAFIFFDEADEFDEETYLGMLSRVRQRDPTSEGKERGAGELTRRGICLASNPAGHNWIHDRFVDPQKKAPNTEWFRSTSFDNPFLAVETLQAYLQYPEPWIKRYVMCQFDDFAGQIYENWNYEQHMIDPIKQYPEDSVFWMGFDPGTRNPNAGLWAYVDQRKRRLVGVAEYEQEGLAAKKHADSWRKIEAGLLRRCVDGHGRVTWRVADPNAVTQRDRGSNMQLDDIYRRLGFNFRLGPSRPQDRVPMLGNLIDTGRFMVTKDCPRTFEAIKNYQWEDLTPQQRAKGIDPPERPLKKDTDLVECAQYLSSRWVRPMKEVIPLPSDASDLERFSERAHVLIQTQLKRKRSGTRARAPGVIV